MSKDHIAYDSAWFEINIHNYHNSHLHRALESAKRRSNLRDIRVLSSLLAPFALGTITGGHLLAIAAGVALFAWDGCKYIRTYQKSDQTLELLEDAQQEIRRNMDIPPCL